MQTTDQGVVYYVDHINKRTSWDPPLMSTGGQSVIASNLPDIRKALFVFVPCARKLTITKTVF